MTLPIPSSSSFFLVLLLCESHALILILILHMIGWTVNGHGLEIKVDETAEVIVQVLIVDGPYY